MRLEKEEGQSENLQRSTFQLIHQFQATLSGDIVEKNEHLTLKTAKKGLKPH